MFPFLRLPFLTLPLVAALALGASSAAAQSKIFYARPDQSAIRVANIDGDTDSAIVTSGTPGPFSVDAAEGKVCWTDFSDAKVFCADQDGTNVVTIVTLSGAVPIKAEIDPVADKVYWSESNFFGADAIRRANLDGTGIENVILPPGSEPLSFFTVDAAEDRIYYVKGTDSDADIVSSALNGTGEVPLVTNIVDVGDLALDRVADKLYWLDKMAAGSSKQENTQSRAEWQLG